MSEQATVIPAQSSNFSYEPPKSEATPDELAEFNSLLSDSIKDIQAEYDPAPEPDAPAEEQVQGQTQDTQDVQEPAADPSAEAPEVTRGIERLVQRELALQTKEAEFNSRQAQFESLRAEVESLRKAVPAKDLLAKFDTSPTDAIKAMGKDPATVVRLMIAEQLAARGEPVPEGLQKFVEKAASERRIAELEARIAERDNAAKEAQVFSAVQSGAREYVKTIDGKKMPSLAKISAADPDLAHSLLMEEIDAQVKRDPNGQLTFPGVATVAETRLARLAKALGPVSTTSTTQAGGQVKPNTPPAAKPPTRPLKPWEQRETSLDAAIQEATREFHVQEAKNRARR
jgi:hypothetical protein